MAKAVEAQEIPEAKIRNAIWYLKKGKTKKFVCEFLGITYNTKKLDSLIKEFQHKQQREADLKTKARKKIFTLAEKQRIAKEYLSGETQAALARSWYISPQRIKNILIEMEVPIRSRGKKAGAKVDHIEQDLEVKFQKDEKVFLAKYNCFAIIDTVFDEEYLDYLENGRQKYREIYPHKQNSEHCDIVENIHYEIYWVLEDNKEMKLSAMKTLRQQIIKNLEDTGREFYRVWRDDDFKRFVYVKRNELFPVRTN